MAEDTTNKPKGTLSIGGTLGANSSGAARPGSVAVEVRKRRFDSPNPMANKAGTVQAPAERGQRLADIEARRRSEALQNAQTQTSSNPHEEALRRAAQLQEEHVKNSTERAKRQSELDAEQKAAAAAAAEARNNRAGSGSGGVQSGTLASAGGHRAVDSRDFSRKPITVEEARRGAGSNAPGKPQQRDLASKRGRNAYLEDLEARNRGTGGNRRRGGRGGRDEATGPAQTQEKIFRDVEIPEFITVGELASRMSEKSADLVKKLMMMGEMVTVNQTIDQATAELIVTEFGHRPKVVAAQNIEADLMEADDSAEQLITRAPIVTIMGHVDHGKTTLLDTLRKTAVVKGEAGGITQHIGAYQITAPSGRIITFLDTPGHAAFTAMRARGAKVTDIVILVVAADDSVMPQTVEAIQHARAAGVPIVVALNKIDKPGANPQKVKNDLLAHDVVIEEFGGQVPCVPVSGLTGKGLPELEEIVLLQADVLDLKANPNRRADGAVVEAKLDKGRGSVATVIVQRGTLRTGDIVVAGAVWGRVRALVNDHGKTVKEATPSMPVEILGINGVPAAGDNFIVAENERAAKEAASAREHQQRERDQAARKMTLENLMEKMSTEGRQELNLIIKADVQGSVEAIAYALGQLNDDQQQVKVKVISGGVGVITENDVNLAVTAGALCIGFNVRADATARQVAEQAGIEIRYYDIIYKLVDDIKAAMSGLLAPSVVEEVSGTAEIRALFKFEKIRIAGCMVTSGKIVRNSKVRLIRDGKVIYTGELATLKRNKDDAKEVASGYECGMTFSNYTDFAEGDTVEAFTMREIKRTIDDLKNVAAKQAPAQPTA
ncbi:MAG TPA: translation initiation factor IF-2 [Alphaproteobacteria bacterium]|nr:translation initiation factor IF-2 [Alphaproteobacteria bacterium]